MTLLFDGSPRSGALAKRYGYDEWLVGRFLQYVPDIDKFLDKMERPPNVCHPYPVERARDVSRVARRVHFERVRRPAQVSIGKIPADSRGDSRRYRKGEQHAHRMY